MKCKTCWRPGVWCNPRYILYRCRHLRNNPQRNLVAKKNKDQKIVIKLRKSFFFCVFRTFWTKFCDILKYGMNWNLESLSIFFRKTTQLNEGTILKKTWSNTIKNQIYKHKPEKTLYPRKHLRSDTVNSKFTAAFEVPLQSYTYFWTYTD